MSIRIDRSRLVEALRIVDVVQSKLPQVAVASYIVYKDENVTRVKDGKTGQVVFSSEDAVDAIQFAIDKAFSEGGGVVLVRRGTYVVDRTIQLKSNVVLEGEGMGLTVFAKVLVTPYGNVRVWVENRTSTTFDIVTDVAPTSNVQVAWYAEV